MTVELDVFSGRPNPQWILTEEETAQVEKLLLNLPDGTEPLAQGLGFKGFILKDDKRRITVGGGSVRADGSNHIYRDTKGLEAYLRNLAKKQGYGELIQ